MSLSVHPLASELFEVFNQNPLIAIPPVNIIAGKIYESLRGILDQLGPT